MNNPGVIVNQRHMTLDQNVAAEEVLGDRIRTTMGTDDDPIIRQLLTRLKAAHHRLRQMSLVEDDWWQIWHETTLRNNQKIWSVPRFEEEVHDLESLRSRGVQAV